LFLSSATPKYSEKQNKKTKISWKKKKNEASHFVAGVFIIRVTQINNAMLETTGGGEMLD
jgi:hypothetical protein